VVAGGAAAAPGVGAAAVAGVGDCGGEALGWVVAGGGAAAAVVAVAGGAAGGAAVWAAWAWTDCCGWTAAAVA
jgi:hypothetical protein